MTIPPDSKMTNIEKLQFKNGAIEIGRFKDEGVIITVIRKQGEEWYLAKADALYRIHYLKKDEDIVRAWDSLKEFVREVKQ